MSATSFVKGLPGALRSLAWKARTARRMRKGKPGLAGQLDAIPIPSGLADGAWLLYGLARSMRPEVCVEIGSALGKSAVFVGTALRENGNGKWK